MVSGTMVKDTNNIQSIDQFFVFFSESNFIIESSNFEWFKKKQSILSTSKKKQNKIKLKSKK
jgi:hypothetical protein